MSGFTRRLILSLGAVGIWGLPTSLRAQELCDVETLRLAAGLGEYEYKVRDDRCEGVHNVPVAQPPELRSLHRFRGEINLADSLRPPITIAWDTLPEDGLVEGETLRLTVTGNLPAREAYRMDTRPPVDAGSWDWDTALLRAAAGPRGITSDALGVRAWIERPELPARLYLPGRISQGGAAQACVPVQGVLWFTARPDSVIVAVTEIVPGGPPISFGERELRGRVGRSYSARQPVALSLPEISKSNVFYSVNITPWVGEQPATLPFLVYSADDTLGCHLNEDG